MALPRYPVVAVFLQYMPRCLPAAPAFVPRIVDPWDIAIEEVGPQAYLLGPDLC